MVHESLIKSSDFSVYVRDRSPFVRFTSKAYVLPRTGQRGIPIVSVNTRAVGIEIYRIGDRNLIDSVVGGDFDRSDFQRSLDRYEVDRMAQSRAVQVWKGELAVESTLNADITTAFPVDQAVGDLVPGVYVMVAEPKPNKADNYDSLATQWFIVSDLGLTAFSGNDGIHAFVNSLATTDAKSGMEVRLISRSNEVLATRRTDAAATRSSRPGSRAGRAAWRLPCWSRSIPRATTPSSISNRRRSISPTAASRAASRRRGSTPSSMPSAASIARARPSISPRCCATRRAWPRPACR